MSPSPDNKRAPAGRLINRDSIFGTSAELPRIVEIELDRLRGNPNQSRTEYPEQSLRELASSIERHGLLQPITVQEAENGVYIIVAGERRLRAHQLLGRKTIFGIVTQGNADEIALIENLQREDLNPIDEATALACLQERHSYSQAELGQVVGKRQSTVGELLKLTTLPEQILEEYRTSDNPPSKSVLIEIARLNSAEEQLRLWEQVRCGVRTVRAARETKEQQSRSEQKSPGAKMLSTGQSFIRHLERIAPSELQANHDQLAQLCELRRRIDELVTNATRQASTNPPA